MARLVGAFGVPHTPGFPEMVAREGPESATGALYGRIRDELNAVRPDLLVIFDSDHLNTFFLDNLPTFAVGVAEETAGPNDGTLGLERRVVPVHREAAQYLIAAGLSEGFDLAQTQRFEVDHSIMVPIHFLAPHLTLPIVPVFINGIVPPLPGARRCFSLGESFAKLIEDWHPDLRVVVLASGSFSLEVGGPRIAPGRPFGVPDPAWAAHVVSRLQSGDGQDLVVEATSQQLSHAGNVAGELLNWLAVLGTVRGRRPDFCEPQEEFGHAYAAWRFDQ